MSPEATEHLPPSFLKIGITYAIARTLDTETTQDTKEICNLFHRAQNNDHTTANPIITRAGHGMSEEEEPVLLEAEAALLSLQWCPFICMPPPRPWQSAEDASGGPEPDCGFCGEGFDVEEAFGRESVAEGFWREGVAVRTRGGLLLFGGWEDVVEGAEVVGERVLPGGVADCEDEGTDGRELALWDVADALPVPL